MRIGGGQVKDSLPITKPLKSNVYDDYVRLQRKVAELEAEVKTLRRGLYFAKKQIHRKNAG